MSDQFDRLAALCALPRVDVTEAWDDLAAAFALVQACTVDVPTEALTMRIDELQREATAALGRGDKRAHRRALSDLAAARRELERKATS